MQNVMGSRTSSPRVRHAMARPLALIAAGILLLAAACPAALARDHGGHGGHGGHGHLFLGFDFFPPYYAYPYAYPYDYPPPAYYYPPPTYYYAPPVYSAPAPTPNCRRFNGDASIDASGQPFYGTACLQADGRWHIAN